MKKYLITEDQRNAIAQTFEAFGIDGALANLKPIEPLTTDEIWNSDLIMSVNADIDLDIDDIERLVRAIEAHITGDQK